MMTDEHDGEPKKVERETNRGLVRACPVCIMLHGAAMIPMTVIDRCSIDVPAKLRFSPVN